MGENSLAVEMRTETGKGSARRTRVAGRVPAVLYGHGKATVSLTFASKDLEDLLKRSHAGLNTLIDLEGATDVKGRVVLVKELQRHPVRGTLVHADLFEIDATERIHVTIPIHLIGTSAGVKLGGVLEHSMREIEVSCLPTGIPDSIDVDINELEIGDTIHLSDVTLPSDIQVNVDMALPVAHVSAPRAEEEVPETEAAAVAEDAADGEGEGEDDKNKEKDKDSD